MRPCRSRDIRLGPRRQRARASWGAAALAALAALILSAGPGCSGKGPCLAPASSLSAHPRRDECVAAPWVTTGDAQAATITACEGHPRGFVIETAGLRPMTEAQHQSFRAHRDGELRAITGVGSVASGGCCAAGATREEALCIRLELALCETSLADLATRLRELVAAEGMGEARALVYVELVGDVGPRCESSEASCGPVPYSGSLDDAGYECHAPRDVVDDESVLSLTGGRCAHDGECVRAGCGNHCVAWPNAGVAATCEALTALESGSTFCGCVSGECRWFRQ